MRQALAGELLSIHITESDRSAGTPLYEAILAACRQLRIAGATVFLGVEGYGETAEMHRGRLVHSDRPVIILVADVTENISRLVPVVEKMMDTGLMERSACRMVRIQATEKAS